jgi:DNA topoisomerase-3
MQEDMSAAPSDRFDRELPDHADASAPPEWLDATPAPEDIPRGERPPPSDDRRPPSRPLPASAQSATRRPPTPVEGLSELLSATFHFDAFRPHQEAVCRSVTSGEHVLLVMPTGAGKSLCYQLPGLARGGTTLVVSPLIALMEDQVAKLQALGLAADRIHSGRERGTGGQVYRDYLSGRLDYLFIAPERLGVPGFVDMLSRRRPTLIAIDEAHCISQWGHDFRPDYRMLGERLPQLLPTPIIALTATATPTVQRDIVRQLGIADVKTFIHGFRRDNIAVEVVELSTGERPELARTLLEAPGRLPAIVYAPTRKQVESLPGELGDNIRAASYHAGMDAARRDRVQTRFLSGELDVIVATIAFGMGIDKADVRTVIHMALPGSVEGYYQEIGRAGRDGTMSRAVMMHSYADHRTHEYFTERDYPDPVELADIFELLSSRPRSRDSLARKLRIDRDLLERRLQKLWVHGGARIDDDLVVRGHAGWERTYVAQRSHKHAQLRNIARYAESPSCRMLQLVEHFGDQEDSGEPCGHCDMCAPQNCTAQRSRESRDDEQRHVAQILALLAAQNRRAVGKMFRDHFEAELQRRDFEALLAGMARANHLKLREESFQKNGRTISYRRA